MRKQAIPCSKISALNTPSWGTINKQAIPFEYHKRNRLSYTVRTISPLGVQMEWEMKRKELNCFFFFLVGNEATSLLEGTTVQGLCWNKSDYLSHLPHTQEDMAKVSLSPSLPPSLPPSLLHSFPPSPPSPSPQVPPLPANCLPPSLLSSLFTPSLSSLPLPPSPSPPSPSPQVPPLPANCLPPFPFVFPLLPPSPPSLPLCALLHYIQFLLWWHTDLLLYPTFKCTPHCRTGIVACTEVLTAQRTSPFPASCIHACTFISC